MADEPACAYCGHPPGVHPNRGRCWNDVRAFTTGWRLCACKAYIEDQEAG